MADGSKQTATEPDEKELNKSSAKRKYLLLDEDLEDLDHELKDNPLNKAYAPMKMFKTSAVKRVAITKWGSLENLEIEHQKRREKQSNLAEKREDETRQLWDCEELYEPMKTFVDKIDLPKNDVPEQQTFGKTIYKQYPAVSDVNKSTPYNDRRKMGHFSWVLNHNAEDKDQLIVNLYVAHKWNFKSRDQASFPVLNFGALELALKRLSTLLTKEWKKDSTDVFGLSIGTYIPYRVEPEKFHKTFKESFEHLIQVFTSLD